MASANNSSGAQEQTPASAVSVLRVRLGAVFFFSSLTIDGLKLTPSNGIFELTKEQLEHLVQQNDGRNLYVGKAE